MLCARIAEALSGPPSNNDSDDCDYGKGIKMIPILLLFFFIIFIIVQCLKVFFNTSMCPIRLIQ